MRTSVNYSTMDAFDLSDETLHQNLNYELLRERCGPSAFVLGDWVYVCGGLTPFDDECKH